jgi:predicted metalloprotease
MVVVAFGLLVPPGRAAAVSVPDGGAAMLADERAATYAVNQFWTRHFQRYFGRPYRAPQVSGGYTSVADAPTCGGAPAQSFNAFYCKSRDFIAWDQHLMSAGYQRIGNAWVYLIIAHEWGHSIQARVSDYLVSQADELQADCLAAAALTGAERDGTLRPDPTDAQQIAQTLAASADKYPWTSSRDHGNAQQRSIAFNLGSTQGVAACMRDIR